MISTKRGEDKTRQEKCDDVHEIILIKKFSFE